MSHDNRPAILEPTVLAILGRAADLARSAERTHARRMLQDLRNGRIAPADVPTWTPGDEHQPTRRQATDDCTCPEVDHEAVIALWAETVPDLPQPLRWTTERQALLRARWREIYRLRTRHGRPCVRDDLLTSFRRVFVGVSESPFLMGRVPGRDGRPPFRCTLDWLLRPANFAKALEGAYERRT